MKTPLGISDKNLKASIEFLSILLANEMMLYVKTRKFDWNVSGDSFLDLHQLFQDQYQQLEETIDQLAERIEKLGGKAIGTMKKFIDESRWNELPGMNPTQNLMLKALSNDYEKVIIMLRRDRNSMSEMNKDAGTTDLLISNVEKWETTNWLLRRYLN